MLLTFTPFSPSKKNNNNNNNNLSLHFRLAQSPTFIAAVVFTSLSLSPLLLFSCFFFFFLILQLGATRIGIHTHVYTKKKSPPTGLFTLLSIHELSSPKTATTTTTRKGAASSRGDFLFVAFRHSPVHFLLSLLFFSLHVFFLC